ncbi:MAG: cytidylate kinase [Actinomycetota bacterium]
MTIVAIDGPAGAGKSTVARMVATRIGVPFLDTGAMYRCVALSILEKGIAVTDVESIAEVARQVHITVTDSVVTLDGVDVSQRIREPEIGTVVSVIAALSPVRDALREQQQAWIADHRGGVIEGRDIGTVVFPNADVKIFLTASPAERAARRVGQNGGDLERVAQEIQARDHIDSNREDSPLKPAPDSIHVDSTGLSIEEVVSSIVDIVHKKQSEHHG